MSFRLSDFWRWSPATSVRYNALVAAIAAWRPDEVEDRSVLARHLLKPPAYMLTDLNLTPETAVVGQPACSVNFTPQAASGPRLFATGFFWPFGPDPPLGDPDVDYEVKITTRDNGGVWDHTYTGRRVREARAGHAVGPFDPHGGASGQPVVWYGGSKVYMANHVINTHLVTDDRIGFFTPRMRGTALLVVMAEDNQ